MYVKVIILQYADTSIQLICTQECGRTSWSFLDVVSLPLRLEQPQLYQFLSKRSSWLVSTSSSVDGLPAPAPAPAAEQPETLQMALLQLPASLCNNHTLIAICMLSNSRPVAASCQRVACFCFLLFLLDLCLQESSQTTCKASCICSSLTACVFLHVWIRSHMHTLQTPAPCPALLRQGHVRVPVPGSSCSVGSASTQGLSTQAAIQQSCVLLVGDHWGCCWPRVWVVVGAARARLGGHKSYGASCCGNPHHPRLLQRVWRVLLSLCCCSCCPAALFPSEVTF